MLKSLKIERFRGIETLSLSDFGRINIFVGGNGSGKTTVLEAICLAASPTAPGTAVRLGAWREQPKATSNNDEAISSFFYHGNLVSGPQFEYDADGKLHKLEISNLTQMEGLQVQISSGESTAASEDDNFDNVRGLTFSLSTPTGNYKSRLQLTPTGPQSTTERSYSGRLGCFYIHARRATSLGEMATNLSRLSRSYRRSEFVEILAEFDSRVKDMEGGSLGGGPVVHVDLGLKNKLPINVLGDGFCRMALIATGFFFKSKVIVVDEIDSGLHTSNMMKFWKNLGSLAKSKDKQVFCATHNEEMLLKTIEAFSSFPEFLRIFRIDRHRDGRVSAVSYTHEKFSRSDRLGLDIR